MIMKKSLKNPVASFDISGENPMGKTYWKPYRLQSYPMISAR
jgi:hypothetical protein